MDKVYQFVYWTHTWEWYHWTPVWLAVVALMVWIWREG